MRACPLLLSLWVGAAPPLSAQGPEHQEHHSTLRIVAYAAGGAILGSWAGFMVSQVVRSDWDNPAGRGAERIRFTVAGASLGLISGLFLGTRGAGAEPRLGPPGLARPAGSKPITDAEIRASQARSLTQLLRELRPEWLRSRGVDVLHVHADPLEVPGVRVYLNGELIGGLGALDQVSIDAVTEVRFLDAASAVLRWGAGNADGAILLTTSAKP